MVIIKISLPFLCNKLPTDYHSCDCRFQQTWNNVKLVVSTHYVIKLNIIFQKRSEDQHTFIGNIKDAVASVLQCSIDNESSYKQLVVQCFSCACHTQ